VSASPSTPPRYTGHSVSSFERAGEIFFRGATASSSVSEADAIKLAHALARQRAEAAAQGHRLARADGAYPYPERVLVEPVLERIYSASSSGQATTEELARVTRNGYGASVLNAYSVMFVDVDTVDDTSNAPTEKTVSQGAAVDALAALCAREKALNFRVYATRAGLRYLCTSRLYDPVSAESQSILRELKADPRYATLCRVQKCYRARLSPKTWRCIEKTPANPGFLARLFATPDRFNRDPSKFVTCRFIESIGSGVTIPFAEQIRHLHDKATGAQIEKPLA
jgi:hypothetical protein